MPIQKRTALQIAASRRNGARSRGPLSTEGKAISARSALDHGLTAKSLLLPGEATQRFDQLLQSLVLQYQPQTDAEFLCLEEMAAAKWRIRRAWTLELATLAGSTPGPEATAGAWSSHQSRLESFHRHESRLLRDYDRSLAALRSHQLERAFEEEAAEAPARQNEPDHTPLSPPAPPSGGHPAPQS